MDSCLFYANLCAAFVHRVLNLLNKIYISSNFPVGRMQIINSADQRFHNPYKVSELRTTGLYTLERTAEVLHLQPKEVQKLTKANTLVTTADGVLGVHIALYLVDTDQMHRMRKLFGFTEKDSEVLAILEQQKQMLSSLAEYRQNISLGQGLKPEILMHRSQFDGNYKLKTLGEVALMYVSTQPDYSAKRSDITKKLTQIAGVPQHDVYRTLDSLVERGLLEGRDLVSDAQFGIAPKYLNAKTPAQN